MACLTGRRPRLIAERRTRSDHIHFTNRTGISGPLLHRKILGIEQSLTCTWQRVIKSATCEFACAPVVRMRRMTDLVKLRRCDRDHRRRQLWAGEAGDYRTDAGLCCSAAGSGQNLLELPVADMERSDTACCFRLVLALNPVIENNVFYFAQIVLTACQILPFVVGVGRYSNALL